MSKTPEEIAEEYIDRIKDKAVNRTHLAWKLAEDYGAVKWLKHKDSKRFGSTQRDYEYTIARDGFYQGYQAAKDQSPDATKWISVKDRLPEINQQFIAFVENKEVCNCCRYQNRSSDNSPSFYASTKTGLLICGLESISHWMPLPAPPKEEK
jgi:hypothetical protein